MAQLFDVAQDECSVIFLWTYLVASLALTVWSTIFLSILSWVWFEKKMEFVWSLVWIFL